MAGLALGVGTNTNDMVMSRPVQEQDFPVRRFRIDRPSPVQGRHSGKVETFSVRDALPNEHDNRDQPGVVNLLADHPRELTSNFHGINVRRVCQQRKNGLELGRWASASTAESPSPFLRLWSPRCGIRSRPEGNVQHFLAAVRLDRARRQGRAEIRVRQPDQNVRVNQTGHYS